ncbi:FIVAR domain-containing protein [Bifidobacterium sp. UTBIF-68]|uniref:FIVAR domain-containing protein n=1 Tax=Bifidobacterium sp. UTBIF-68 TaxID=1465262 RepID=UPI0015E374BA|nr:FIVAR domain-containing protein [Bifidobacterium sp. UTBIF-68]
MGKVVAVLAGLSMMLTGVGTAYADDAAGDAAVSQSQTATADAQAAQAQADAAKADQNAKQSAKTPAPANVDPQVKAAPKAQAKAAASDSAKISGVVAPSTALKYGADYDHVDESAAFKVTLTGLTPGKAYGVKSSMNAFNGLPAIGQTTWTYGYTDPVFTASASTQTIDVFYRGSVKPSSTVQFALVAGDKVNVDNWGNKSLNGTVINTYGGVNVKVLDVTGSNLVTLDSQSVEDIGVHTVGLKGHYTIDPKIAGSVAKVCYSTTVTRVFKVNGTFDADIVGSIAYNGRYVWDCVTGAISDDDDPEIDNLFKVNDLITLAAGASGSQTMTGQWFSHGFTITAKDGKPIPASGDIENVVPGLLANTKYGNWGYSSADMGAQELIYDTAKSQTTQPDPASLMYSGIVLTFDDGSQLVPVASSYRPEVQPNALKTVSDFTTKAATNGPVASDDLTDANKNGVEGADGNKANAGSVYRLYIDSLKESATCKALVEKGSYCYWTGYIYSTPKQLASPDGKSSAVRVDKDGKAYVEFNIPADTVNGDHKIALYDSDGKLLGWTPVTVAEGQEPTPQPEKPSAEDVAALQSAIKDAESKKQADYTAESWAPFAAALKSAQDVAAKSDATKAEVTAATAKLAEASSNLVKAGSTTPQPEKPSAEDVYALQSAIKTAESKKQADYTAASWSTFAAALKAAQDVAAKSDATKAEVTAATAKLAEASKNLVKAGSTTPTKPDKPTKPTTPNKPDKDNDKNQQKLPITGSSVLVIAFVAIALVAAGVSVVVYRRRNA